MIPVSEKWNYDTRGVINLIESCQSQIKKSHSTQPNDYQKVLDKLHNRLFTLYGVINESMPRDNGYYLLEAGKLIERILSRVRIIRSAFSFKTDSNVENQLIEAVLTNHYLLVHYRQIYKTNCSLETLLDMILLDRQLPYSIAFQLDALSDCLAKLPNTDTNKHLNPAQKAVLAASTKVKLADISKLTHFKKDTLYRKKLDKVLAEVYDLVTSVTTGLTQAYFAHTIIQHVEKEITETNEV